jgi:hypothetical protein
VPNLTTVYSNEQAGINPPWFHELPTAGSYESIKGFYHYLKLSIEFHHISRTNLELSNHVEKKSKSTINQGI